MNACETPTIPNSSDESKLRRIKLVIEYDGTKYAGWQRQLNATSVQQVIENALTRLTGAHVTLVGASRTDAGVHALGQTAHFDTECRIPAEKICFALNTMLPRDIRICASTLASNEFHARFDAKGKIYRYLIHNSPHASAMNRDFCAHVTYPLDLNIMQREAQSMLGTHDFASFAASGSVVKNTVRTIHAIRVSRSEQLVMLLVQGDGFLYNMVRILAGTLIGVGTGKLAPGAIERSLQGGDRLSLGVTAPAHGLTLMRVFYDDYDASGAYFNQIGVTGW